MPLDWDLDGPDGLCYSTMTDIGKLGAVMFHIITEEECKFDIWNQGETPAWPRRDDLPSTKGVWLGHCY